MFTNQGFLAFNNNALVDGGTAGFQLENGPPVAGTNVSLAFNDDSGITSTVDLASTGGSASGVGGLALGGAADVAFNGTSYADGADLRFFAGTGGGQGGVGTTGSGVGGNSTASFNGASHADNASFGNVSGSAIGLGGDGQLSTGVGIGGGALLTFNDSSHADGAFFTNLDGNATTVGGSAGASATAISGAATITFNDDAHADNAEFNNNAAVITSVGGSGAVGTPGGTGANGGAGTSIGSGAQIVFNGNSHADGSSFFNTNSGATVLGGTGGTGDTGTGGAAGSATAISGLASITFNDASHADNSVFANTSMVATAIAGTGGTGGATGDGGQGGSATAVSGGTYLTFANATGTTGTTITNTAGDAVVQGGTGGTGGAGGIGGRGGDSVASGGAAIILFNGTASAGTGSTIVNQGGDATAAGGTGGTGGTGAAGGRGGDADARGGDAIVEFNDDASAGNATITNTAGTGTIFGGNGGNGDAGAGGNGGTSTALGGQAVIRFNDNATAGSAVILNNGAAPVTANGGTTGADGISGGAGGAPGGGGVSSAQALIEFNGDATGGDAKITNTGANTVFNDNAVFGTAAGAAITNFNFGSAVFNDSASLGGGAIQNNNGGSAIFYDGATAGSGTITNAAGGFTQFRDTSSAGSATINNAAGAMTTFADNSLAGTATINNSGTLNFLVASDAVAARVINGAGGTVFVGINAFRLGSLSGTGSVNNNGNTVQLGYLDLNDTFAGMISGAGGLVKRGTGALVLSGANTYTGDTNVAAGMLQVDGSLTSNTILAAAGSLRGTGTITGNVVNNGIINPGNAAAPLGTLTVTGDVAFSGGSFLAPTLTSAGASSLLQAGSLTINGGTVRPVAATGGLFLMQTDYRIANGTGGRTGTFGGVDESQLPTFLDASLFYTPTDVFIRVRRNATNFAQVAGLTPNQSSVSTALDTAVPAANPLVYTTYLGTYNALLALPANGQLQAGLDRLSGDALTALPVAAQEHSSRFAQRLDANLWSNSSNLWGLVAYGDQEADGDGNGPGFDANGVEFQLGFNTSLGPNTRLGLSVGMNNGDVDIDDRLASADIDSWSVGAQLRHDFGRVYVSGQLTYSWHNIESSRALLLGGTATADFDANTWTAAGEIGGVFRSGQLSIEPHVSIRHANTDQDGYSESGPVGALDVAAANYETTRFGLGVRLANRDPAAPVRFHALVRYERETGDRRSVLDNALPGLPTFRVLGTRLGDDILTADVGVEVRIGGGWSLFAAGGGHVRDNETSLNGNAGIRIAF